METKDGGRVCVICGDKANYRYFGVVACHSCKTFFRRYAENGKTKFKCSFDENCPINPLNRRFCQSCRLKKCFSGGMSPDLIRASRTKQEKSTVNTKQLVPIQKQTETIRRDSLSLMNCNQWNLLSKLVLCFDTHSGSSITKRFIRDQLGLPMKLRFRPQSIIDFTNELIIQSQRVIEKIRDFHCFTFQDRWNLLKTSGNYTFSFALGFTIRQYRILECPIYFQSAKNVFGESVIEPLFYLSKQYDFDTTFMKLIPGLIAFSTTNLTIYRGSPVDYLVDRRILLSIENIYVDLAWNYLVHNFGHSKAIHCFVQLTRCLLLVLSIIDSAEGNRVYQQVTSNASQINGVLY